MAAVFFLFPIVFLLIMWTTKYEKNRQWLLISAGATAVIGLWLYLGIVFDWDYGPLELDPNELNVFAAVVFASSPGVFRIVRGLAMDIKTRDYVAAAQTRGERPWYIMLWEILPNARGPLIVDFCLRVGYTTILLGTLGFFGLGLDPESPDWGSMINHGRSFVRLASTAHMALFPAVALMTLVLGLNLLADGLREESLRD
jgi:peptide/nickel transport system permease protein